MSRFRVDRVRPDKSTAGVGSKETREAAVALANSLGDITGNAYKVTDMESGEVVLYRAAKGDSSGG